MRNRVICVVGIVLALWMGAGRWAYGIGGELTWWFVPGVALPFLVLQIASACRISVAEARGHKVGPSIFVALGISWLCAIGFGFTVPDYSNGELVSIMSQSIGGVSTELSIAFCNPLGIISLASSIAALIFSHLATRDPRLTDDELLDQAEIRMVEHPLRQH